MKRIMQTLIALDQVLNAALCNGQADETMSSHSWRMDQANKPWGILRKGIDFLASPWQSDHCHKSYIAGAARRAILIEDRK